MMGNDVERIVSTITSIKDALASSIVLLASVMGTFIETTGPHADGEAEHKGKEIPQPSSAASFVQPATSILDSLKPDISKMNTLKSELYTSASNFNNSTGSPWTELGLLESSVNDAKSYAASHPDIEFVGSKAGLMGCLQVALSRSVDAKWAMIIYHDYIQRGYDCVFHGNVPSIMFDSGIEQKSIGNVSQAYDENVNVPKKSTDPF